MLKMILFSQLERFIAASLVKTSDDLPGLKSVPGWEQEVAPISGESCFHRPP